mmetsp:Transcript_85562/g.276112  ORF Transcript_85562/g.276112 Transcript_85562/m.276112 type:complete len:178 (-) Transcript_85562:426-959(-)
MGTTTSKHRSATLEWESMVAKQFKKTCGSSDDQPRYLAQMENSNIAAVLAQEYNKSKEAGHKRIELLRSYVVEIDGRLFSLEKPLPGGSAFKRFSANTGFWDPKHYDPTLGAFCRWTLLNTEGYLLVSDLQGVELKDRFVLTDPAILCEDLSRFWGTNLGPDFMERVLKSLNAVEKC